MASLASSPIGLVMANAAMDVNMVPDPAARLGDEEEGFREAAASSTSSFAVDEGRRFRSVVNIRGYAYIRANISRHRTTFRCSGYQRTSCRGRCELR